MRKSREARRNNSKENQLVSYDNSLNGGIDPNILDFTMQSTIFDEIINLLNDKPSIGQGKMMI